MSPIRAVILKALARPGAPTQAALARAADIAPENLNKWLRGQRPTIPLVTAERLLTALGLKIVPAEKEN